MLLAPIASLVLGVLFSVQYRSLWPYAIPVISTVAIFTLISSIAAPIQVRDTKRMESVAAFVLLIFFIAVWTFFNRVHGA